MPAQNSYNPATPADGDYVTGVDISDTTQSVSGSTASFLFSAIYSYVRGKLLAVTNTFSADQTLNPGRLGIGPNADVRSAGYDAYLDIQDYDVAVSPSNTTVYGATVSIGLDSSTDA